MYTIAEMMNSEIKKPKESQKRDVLERIKLFAKQNGCLTKMKQGEKVVACVRHQIY